MRHPPDPNPPGAGALQAAAVTHLARYATTEAGLRRVLERRIDRWARGAASLMEPEAIAAHAAAARQTVRDVVARLAAAGAVNDAAFAESRARSLVRAGRSRRAALAQLTIKGVDAEAAQAALPADEATELAAALVLARRRRIGPFRGGGTPDADGRRRELAMLARAGFPAAIAIRALATQAAEAEAIIAALRRG